MKALGLLAALALLPAWASARPFPFGAARRPGVLLLAHGGVSNWDQDVLDVAREAAKEFPVEVAFGMADGDRLQAAVDRLEKRGINDIVAVPLFVSSDSEVLDQTRFLLHLRDKPSEVFVNAMNTMQAAMPHHMMPPGHSMKISMTPIKLEGGVKVRMTPALDDDPLVVDILKEHAQALSRDPGRDALIIVGHGPVDDAANSKWLKMLGGMAEAIRKSVGFRAAFGATIRDDSPPAVKQAAIAGLRDLVKSAEQNRGRAIVVPDLIARGGIEDHIASALSGLDYAWDGRTLLPHPNIAKWVVQSARGAISAQ